jgi:hypothetical protein
VHATLRAAEAEAKEDTLKLQRVPLPLGEREKLQLAALPDAGVPPVLLPARAS